MNNNEALIDQPKRGRGRPKGSKNKPKDDQEIQFKQKLSRSTGVKRVPEKPIKKMNKKQTDTYFIIKPKSGGKCYYQSEITVDYTPFRENENQDKVSIVPRLNTDNKPHIPGFIMDMDRGYYEKHDQRYKEDHEAKISDYTKPKSRLYLPKPGKRHNYCCVCKQSYEDYLDHVTSNTHKKSYNNNDFTQFIKALSKEYEHNHRNNLKLQDQPDQQTDTLTQEEDDCQVIGYPDSSTQKYGTKISNEKQNKGSPNQYINGAIHPSQILKKASSQMSASDLKAHAYLQKSAVSMIKTGSALDTTLNYERSLNQYPSHSLPNTCLLTNKQPSTTQFFPSMQITANPGYYPNNLTGYAMNNMNSNINSNEDHIVPNVSNQNSHNNSLNNFSNNNNQTIKSSNMKKNMFQSSFGALNNTVTVPNNNSSIINMKRKAENYQAYNEAVEGPRKQFQAMKQQIIDLTEDGNDLQKPTTSQIVTQNPTQNRSMQYQQYPFVVCKD